MKKELVVGVLIGILIIFSVLFAFNFDKITGNAVKTNPENILNKKFFNNSAFDLVSDKGIYGLSINGKVNLNSENSLVRVVLVDNQGKEYLVYETYNLINDNSTKLLGFNNECDETCTLNNIIPKSLKVQVIDGSLKLESLKFNEFLTKEAKTKGVENYRKEIKKVKDAKKINNTDKKIKQLYPAWAVGETSFSKLTYEEKRRLFADKKGSVPEYLPNLQGFEYYKGGIFVPSSENIQIAQSSITGNAVAGSNDLSLPLYWDWRNVNGENWMTPVKNQGIAPTCERFAAIGAIESQVNLFYNQPLNVDLSEQMFTDCGWPGDESAIQEEIYAMKEAACSIYGGPKSVLCYFMKVGAVDEQADVYSDVGSIYGGPDQKKCNETYIVDDWRERLWIVNDFKIYKGLDLQNNELSTNINEFEMKKSLVTNGPAYATIGSWMHAMVLAGFGTIKEGDFLFFDSYNNPITVDAGNPLIGKTYWIFKNSWGSNWGEQGYLKFITSYENLALSAGPVGPFIPPINHSYWPVGFDGKIKCVDKDIDGYCTWGISDIGLDTTWRLSNCPETCRANSLRDCDDSNPLLGKANLNFSCEKIGITNCRDNDTGINAWILGKVNYKDIDYLDYCIVGKNTVNEFYCTSDSRLTQKTINCGSKNFCSNGACVVKICADSDNGKDISIKGTVTTNGNVSRTDYCQSNNKLNEFYCNSNNDIKQDLISCGNNNACSDGKCSKK